MLDFNNTEIAFSSKSRGELQNAYWLFNTIKYPWLVKCAKVATSIALKIHFPLAWAVKPTLYKQFVGGGDLAGLLRCHQPLDEIQREIDARLFGGERADPGGHTSDFRGNLALDRFCERKYESGLCRIQTIHDHDR